jgi:hypothetical protein
MMSRSPKAEPRCPSRSAPKASPAPQIALFGSRERMRRQARNKNAVNPLKTNNLAKSLISRPNDLNDLRSSSRNRSFRLAKDSFRFRCFWASSTPETQRAPPGACRRRAEAGTPRSGSRIGRLEARGRLGSCCGKNCAKKKLRKGGVKPMKSLARATSCAGAL